MPFTPYHFGPGLFIGLIFLSFLDFPTFLIASVIVDVEPFLVLVFNLDYPLHGFFHSFLGGTIATFILAGFMLMIRKYFTPIMSFFKLELPFYRNTSLPGYTEMMICVWCYFGAFLVYVIRLIIYLKKRPKMVKHENDNYDF